MAEAYPTTNDIPSSVVGAGEAGMAISPEGEGDSQVRECMNWLGFWNALGLMLKETFSRGKACPKCPINRGPHNKLTNYLPK